MRVTVDMRWIIGVLVVVCLIAAGAAAVRAIVPESATGRVHDQGSGVYVEAARYGEEGVRVSGTAVVRAKPDLATVVLGHESCTDSVTTSKDECDHAMREVISVLKKQGIEPKNIQTVRYSIDKYCCCTSQCYHHWHVVNMVQVRIYKVERVADVIESAVKAGANKAEAVEYSVESLHALRAKAREKAVQVAREKAEQLAALTNVRLGPLVSINDVSNQYSYGWYSNSNMASNAQSSIQSPSSGEDASASEMSEGQVAVQAREEMVFAVQ